MSRQSRGATQPMILVQSHLDDGIQSFDVLGTRGNSYQVTLLQEPICTCPDYETREIRCKHIYFVLQRVLGQSDDFARRDMYTHEELAALKGVTVRVSGSSPPPLYSHVGGPLNEPPNHVPSSLQPSPRLLQSHPQQQPLVPARPLEEQGQCPICFEDMEEKSELIYCGVACGYSMHKECHQRWIKAKGGHKGKRYHEPLALECPLCRSTWKVLYSCK
jgi:hypothetical protein